LESHSRFGKSRRYPVRGQLNDIVGSVTSISTLVSEIAQSSEEQAAGVDEIRHAVDQLKNITEQNLQMVVQATSSSQSMGSRADELSRGLSFFTFDASDSDTHVNIRAA